MITCLCENSDGSTQGIVKKKVERVMNRKEGEQLIEGRGMRQEDREKEEGSKRERERERE